MQGNLLDGSSLTLWGGDTGLQPAMGYKHQLYRICKMYVCLQNYKIRRQSSTKLSESQTSTTL